MIDNLLSLGRNIQHLALPRGVGDQEANDDVSVTRLMPDLHMLPGLWTIDGYGKLVNGLKARFALTEASTTQPGNLLLFPYDWRLSNVLSASQLAETASRELDRWRKHTLNPDAKLVLICHSMGGLVARWFLEVLGGREITGSGPAEAVIASVEKKEIPISALAPVVHQSAGEIPLPMLVPQTFRLPQRLVEDLARAAIERKIKRRKPWSQQEIVAEAIKEWLRKHVSK